MTSIITDQATMLRPLRLHQEEAITGLRDAVRAGHTRVVLQMATGAGKTLTAAHMIVSSLAKGHRAMFCVPRISLIDQTVTAFEAEGITDIGVIQAKHPRENVNATVQVASVQTLQRRLDNLVRDGFVMPRLVIVDEAHEGFELIYRMIADFPQTIFVGLSATPWAKGMGKHWQSLVVAATTERLIREGFLSQFTVFAPYVPSLRDVKVSRGDYVEAELEKVMGEAKIVGNVVQTWLEKGGDRPSLLFGVNRKHAQDLQKQFLSHGVSAGYCDAYTDMQERKVWETRFRAGEVKVMCSVRTLTTGIDWPVSCILDCAPTKSEMLHVQRIGRGLRINPGTEDCLARGTQVLTDRGLCKIEHITLDHKVWDGVNFVRHGGAVCKGAKAVMTYDGVTATPDHRVATKFGWMTIHDAAYRKIRITRSGIGRAKIRVFADCLSENRREGRFFASSGPMRAVPQGTRRALYKHQKTAQYKSLPPLQWQETCIGAEMALSAVPKPKRPLREREVTIIPKVWGQGNRISVSERESGKRVDHGKFGASGKGVRIGQNRQQRTLRAWEFAMGYTSTEYCQQPNVQELQREVFGLSNGKSRNSIFRSMAKRPDKPRVKRFTNLSEVGNFSIEESIYEVWDIHNAGPLQRFTANGRLVHNCLILDFAGNSLSLGLVTDIHHETLDVGDVKKGASQERTKKLPKPCPACGALHTGLVCVACGNELKPGRGGVKEVDGDLVELKSRRKVKGDEERSDLDRPQVFWSMALWLDNERDRGGKLARGLYKGKFGGWPRGMLDYPMEPSRAFMNYEKSRRIAYAKAMERARA